MKKIIAVILLITVAALCFSGCRKKNGTGAGSSSDPSVSSDSSSSKIGTASEPVDSKGNIINYSPSAKEEHVITDEGESLKSSTNDLLGAATFVLDTCALGVACGDGKIGETILTDSMENKYYSRAVQRKAAFERDAEISAEEFNSIVKDYFGTDMSGKDVSVQGMTALSNGKYKVSVFDDEAAWGLMFTSAEALGNGFIKYTGTFSYCKDGDLENEVIYSAVCLLKYTSESNEGRNLVSFMLTDFAEDAEQ